MGFYRFKPSKQAKKEFAIKMQEINEFCIENNIDQSRTSDSYYFSINGQRYRVSNHAVHNWQYYHPEGREENVIYIHASKTRIIEIYNNLKNGFKLDGRGNIKN